MDKALRDALIHEIGTSTVIGELQSLAHECAGVDLRFILRSGPHVLELSPPGQGRHLPDFCRMIRISRQGRQRCRACRCLITFGARYRGLSTFHCHGGVAIIAAPAPGTVAEPDGCIVAVGGAFASEDAKGGWRAAHKDLKGIAQDLSGIRKAYKDLPVLTTVRGSTISHIVTAAAAEADVIRVKLLKTPNRSSHGRQRMTSHDMIETIGDALVSTRGRENRNPGETPGRTLADLIAAMVRHDPSLPFTVENIARSAHLTPNYFSTLFKKQTGSTFIEFLTAQRITLAQRLLADYRLNIAQVAERAGFYDQAYFCRRFKKALGVPPRTWRQGKPRMT